MTDETERSATPLCQSIELALTNQPDVKNKYGSGRLRPQRVVFYYLDGRINAHLYGVWICEDGEVTDAPVDQDYRHDADWPDWLASLARAHQPAVAPATDWADLRDRIADALATFDGWVFADGFREISPTFERYRQRAGAVLAELPETARLHDEILTLRADLAKVRDLLRTENQRGNDAIDREETAEETALEAQQDLRRLRLMVDETQPATEAHPAEHTWAAELHDPLADQWVPGTRYIARDRAVNALTHARMIGPTWKDGTPTERRLVRATTTYTVEPAPAVVAQPDEEADRG